MEKKREKPFMILIVDDIPQNIQVVASLLRPEGYQLAFAQNGKAALAQAQAHPVDLILLDVMMPDIDGFEVCSQLKASPATRQIPIIFLTGKVETDNIVQGFALGAVDYVTKPFNREELLARVKTHLELKQAREQIQVFYEQIDEELNIASGIQKNVMRTTTKVPFLSFALRFEPFGKVSGDIVDCWAEGDEELRIFIGDATGHGVPAALITMMIPFILDSREQYEYTNGVIARINNALVQRQVEGKFITGIYTKINSDGHLFTCNGGHPPLIIIPADDSPLVQLRDNGTVMGIFAADHLPPYEEISYQLKPGDKFFLYTDGITEWPNRGEKQFGWERLKNCLEENRKSEVESILNTILEQVEMFSEGTPCDDDYTLLGFEYLGTQ